MPKFQKVVTMANETHNCGRCVYWLPDERMSDKRADYGYCVRRDVYKPELLTCEQWRARAPKEGGVV